MELPPNRLKVPFHGSVLTTHWKNDSCKQSMQTRCRKNKIFSWVGQRNSPELKTHDMLCKKMKVWEVDDGDILCHPILVPSYLQQFDDANDKIAAERNPQKAEVIYYVADLAAAPPEWKVDEVRKLASVSTAATGSNTRGVAAGPRQFIAEKLQAKADAIRALHERVQLCQDPQTEFALLRESLGVSPVSITFFGCTGTRSCKRNGLLTCMMRLGKGPWKGSSRDSRRTLRSKRHSAQASLGLDTGGHVTSRVQHTMEHSLQPNGASWL